MCRCSRYFEWEGAQSGARGKKRKKAPKWQMVLEQASAQSPLLLDKTVNPLNQRLKRHGKVLISNKWKPVLNSVYAPPIIIFQSQVVVWKGLFNYKPSLAGFLMHMFSCLLTHKSNRLIAWQQLNDSGMVDLNVSRLLVPNRQVWVFQKLMSS